MKGLRAMFAGLLYGMGVVLILVGCAAPLWVTAPLPDPPAVVLPTIEAESLNCLDDATYEKLVVREARLRTEIAQLRAIIATHNEAARGK